ncbi:MAG: hypothetical protein Q9190_002204 [Brigantiaea leucoxantha]
MRENAQQISSVVRASFGDQWLNAQFDSTSCINAESDKDQLGCLWHETNNARNTQVMVHDDALLALTRFSKRAQQVMSGNASKYDMSKLYIGILTASTAFLMVAQSFGEILSESKKPAVWFVLVTFGYGVAMFASSYVEEEQQFWYWVGSAWLGWLVIKW